MMRASGWPMTMKRASKTPLRRRAALARVRRACLALPGSCEKEAWGAPTFRARGRLFLMFVDNHHGDGRLAIWCKAPPGAQEALVASLPRHYFVPPYVGPQGWVGVRLDTGLKWAAVATRIAAAHGMNLPATRIRKETRPADRAASAPGPSRRGRGSRRSRG